MLRRTFLIRCSRQPTSPTTSLHSSTAHSSQSCLAKVQVAIIGSGPSGCYLADSLIKKHPNIHVDIYERLPVPFGLVRYGVAPDHPEVKNVEKRFIDVFKNVNVSWIGNVTIGRDITVAQLREAYSAVVVATGADCSRKLDNIPGHDLLNIISAKDFVNYYNTFPFPYSTPLTPPFDIMNAKNAVLIGNGNVALDIARVLATSSKHWSSTDINCCAVRDLLIENRLRKVSVIGRRGPENAAFTTAEFRELCRLSSSKTSTSDKKGGISDSSVSTTDGIQGNIGSRVKDKNEEVLTPHDDQVNIEVEYFDLDSTLAKSDGSRARKRLIELMSKYTANNNEVYPSASVISNAGGLPCFGSETKQRGLCTIDYKFNLRPIQFIPRSDRKDHVGGVVFERSQQDVNGVVDHVTIPADVVFISVGYKGTSLPGVPFDEVLGVVPNVRGRVLRLIPSAVENNMSSDVCAEDNVIPGLYCCGWVKRGPHGVILSAMMDAQDTAGVIVDDLNKRGEGANPVNVDIKQGKFKLIDFMMDKKIMPVSVNNSELILNYEKEQGGYFGKRLEKVPDINTMLDIAFRGKADIKKIKQPAMELLHEYTINTSETTKA